MAVEVASSENVRHTRSSTPPLPLQSLPIVVLDGEGKDEYSSGGGRQKIKRRPSRKIEHTQEKDKSRATTFQRTQV